MTAGCAVSRRDETGTLPSNPVAPLTGQGSSPPQPTSEFLFLGDDIPREQEEEVIYPVTPPVSWPRVFPQL